MNWRAKFGWLVLTRDEQRTIAFVVLALVLGLATKHYRHIHSKEVRPNEIPDLTAEVSPSPSPAKRGEGIP
jgi:hypothetical protein